MENVSGAGEPAPTITTKDRLALVTVMIKSTPYVIVDICLRMLQPAELYKAQGFPADYIISHGADGLPRPSRSICAGTASALHRWRRWQERTTLGGWLSCRL